MIFNWERKAEACWENNLKINDVSGAQSQIQAPSNSKLLSISASESKTDSLKVLVLGQLQCWKEII